MPKKPTAYYRPSDLQEALSLLSKPDTVPLAGGTHLLAKGTSGAVVDLQALGLDKVNFEGGTLSIGAMVRVADLAESLLADNLQDNVADDSSGPDKLLRNALMRSGPNTYRNAATVGGIIASRLADSEFLASLLVLEATIVIRGAAVHRLSVEEYLLPATCPSGLITRVDIPWRSGNWAAERVARTPADYPIVSVTLFRPDKGEPRLAATGIDDRPLRVLEAERKLLERAAPEEVALEAKRASRHPGDFRGDATYRAEMAFVLTRRILDADYGGC